MNLPKEVSLCNQTHFLNDVFALSVEWVPWFGQYSLHLLLPTQFPDQVENCWDPDRLYVNDNTHTITLSLLLHAHAVVGDKLSAVIEEDQQVCHNSSYISSYIM